MKKVLFVAAHADDETLGCGGTILKHKAQGDEIHWLLMSGPTADPPMFYSQEVIDRRANTVKKVEAAYQFDSVIYLGFQAMFLHQIDAKDMIAKIDEAIMRIKPEIIYLMNSTDVHSDHRIAFDAVYACTKSFRKPFIEQILMLEALSETEFALATQATSFCPNVYVDITPYMDKKLEIMDMYKDQLMEEPYPRSLSSIKALARVRGSRAGVMYAEAFQLLYEKR